MFTVEKKIVQELPPPDFITIEYFGNHTNIFSNNLLKLGKEDYLIFEMEVVDDIRCCGRDEVRTKLHLKRIRKAQ